MINKDFHPYLTEREHGEEIIRGAHISMFQIVEPKQGDPLYLNKEKYLTSRREGGKAFHFQNERLVYQRYAAIDNYRRLIATILPIGHFCSHTVGYFAEVRKGIDLGFFAALLNTRLLDWRFNLTSTNNNINGYEIEALPVPRIDFTTPSETRAIELARIRDLVESRRVDEALALAKSYLPKSPDIVHDILAYLAEQMIALHQSRQVEVKGFLAWLVHEIGATLDDLNGKTTLKNYLGDYQKDESPATLEKILEILRNNRRKLRKGLDISGRDFTERLSREYEASLDKLLPIKARLAATDRLIDQIVYALYGLTDEEIAVVEEGK